MYNCMKIRLLKIDLLQQCNLPFEGLGTQGKFKGKFKSNLEAPTTLNTCKETIQLAQFFFFSLISMHLENWHHRNERHCPCHNKTFQYLEEMMQRVCKPVTISKYRDFISTPRVNFSQMFSFLNVTQSHPSYPSPLKPSPTPLHHCNLFVNGFL